MLRAHFVWAVLGTVLSCGLAAGQSPSVLYTWDGTGNLQNWQRSTGQPNFTVLSNSTPGQLTITEQGDEFDPGSLDPAYYGQSHIFQDSFDYIRENTTASGGIDLTGLQFLEMDVSHNGTGNVSVQPFIGTGRNSTYTWFGPGPDYTASGAAWVIPPNTVTTVRIPIYKLASDLQAYSRVVGVKVFGHADQGYLTWNVSEVRSTGTPLTTRTLASHDVGSSDGGLNGAFVNFGNSAVQGNDGGQNQTGLSQNAAGSGSLQWTDIGTHGVSGAPSGAAISWVNGTAFYGNTFYERPADFSNYNRVTFRMSATDPLAGGGAVGVQAFFQTLHGPTANYTYNITSGGAVGQYGEIALPVDGQFHDLTFPISGVPDLNLAATFGAHLFSHTNDLIINVDNIEFSFVTGTPGDYNGNGTVDAADYVLWRNGGPLQNEVDVPGTVNAADYTAWKARFGNTSGSGNLGSEAVPEPNSFAIVLGVLIVTLLHTRRLS